MAKSRRQTKSKKYAKKGKRSRRSQRGGAGAGWGPGGALIPGSGQPNMINQPYDACLSASRPGMIPFSLQGGLPGMQRGGAYTNLLPSPVNGLAGFMEIAKDTSHCMPNYQNPLNQRGGVGGVASSASPILEQSNAAYTQNPGSLNFKDMTGGLHMINQPSSTLFSSKACGQTGGRHRKAKRRSKSARRSAKRSRRSAKRSRRS
jgi:hypothetical protein